VLTAERTPASFDRRTLERVGRTWVAEAAGAVAGFVVVVDDEVEQLYVDRSWRGRGPFTYQRRRRPARSQFPPTDTSARWAADENPPSPPRADRRSIVKGAS
jgi:hypothetical protein